MFRVVKDAVQSRSYPLRLFGLTKGGQSQWYATLHIMGFERKIIIQDVGCERSSRITLTPFRNVQNHPSSMFLVL